MDLGKPDNMSWETYWKEKGWEMRCWEFWKNQVDVLDHLQVRDDNTLPDEAALFGCINDLLQKYERLNENLTILTDTIGFDTHWINARLEQYGHADLARDRDFTGYRSGIEVDSYRYGVVGWDPTCPWSEFTEAWDKLVEAHPMPMPKDVNKAHDPEYDALKIWRDFCIARAAIKSRSL